MNWADHFEDFRLISKFLKSSVTFYKHLGLNCIGTRTQLTREYCVRVMRGILHSLHIFQQYPISLFLVAWKWTSCVLLIVVLWYCKIFMRSFIIFLFVRIKQAVPGKENGESYVETSIVVITNSIPPLSLIISSALSPHQYLWYRLFCNISLNASILISVNTNVFLSFLFNCLCLFLSILISFFSFYDLLFLYLSFLKRRG